MTKRISSFLLAAVTILSLAVPALAEEPETGAEPAVIGEPAETAAPAAIEEPLDGAEDVETTAAPADMPAPAGEAEETASLPTEGECGDDVRWSLSGDGVLTVTGSGRMKDYSEQIAPWLDPDTLTDSRIKKVVIGSGVTYVGAYAFSFCRALTEVVIPGAADGTAIGNGAFARCASLTRVELGSGVQAMGQGAFLECGSLRQIALPDTLQSVGHLAFSSCLALEEVAFPPQLKSIGQYAFSNCESLTVLDIPDSVTSIGAMAFTGCIGLTSVSLGESLQTIGDYAFGGCTSLRSAPLPGQVTSLGVQAFSRTALTSVTLPASVSKVGFAAFAACRSLQSITVMNDSCTFSLARPSGDESDEAAALGIPGVTTVYGAAGSTAETFARRYGFGFTESQTQTPIFTPKPVPTEPPAPVRPVISAVEPASSGIKLTWQPMDGAGKYRVFYATEINGDGTPAWKKLADTSATSYTWKKASDNTTYYFSLRCMDAKAKKYLSDYARGVPFKRLSTPTVTLTNQTGGVMVSWKDVDAPRYKVTVNGAEQSITSGDVLPVETSNTKFTLTVQAVDASGVPMSVVASKSITFLSAPAITKLEAASSGIKVTWGKVSGAAKYRVYYRTDPAGSWKKLANTGSTSYTWKKAKTGTKYYFSVVCMDKNYKKATSAKYEKETDTYALLATPSVTLSNQTNGVKVSWKAVTNAVKYTVTVNGEEATVSDTTYLYDKAVNKTKYTVTVQSLGADERTLGKVSAAKSITYLNAPVITEIKASSNGIKITWDKVDGAAKYRVYYATKLDTDGTPVWKKLTDTKGTASGESLTYTWKKASYKTYWFTVAAMNGKSVGSGKYEDMGDTITLLKPPSVSLANTPEGVKVSWKAVTDAVKYTVTVNGEATTVTGTEHTFKAENDTTYKVTVQSLGADGRTLGKVSATKSIKHLNAPVITAVKASSSGIQISWDKVIGASRYRVYYATKPDADGKPAWKKLANTKSTSYNWKKATANTTYYFTVVCMDSKYKKATSAKYDDKRNEFKLLAAPGVTAALAREDGQDVIKLSWTAVTGAESYRVSIKKDGAWQTLADTAETGYSYKDLTSGGSYTFTVWCVDGAGKCVSKYASAGKTVKYYPAPTGISVKMTEYGMEVSWQDVPGAIPEGAVMPKDIKYRVFYKTSPDGAWKKLKDTGWNYYIWEPSKTGDYWFAVVCVDKKGKTVLSAYEETVTSIAFVKELDISAAEAAIEEYAKSLGYEIKDASSYNPDYFNGSSQSGMIAKGCELVDEVYQTACEQNYKPYSIDCVIRKNAGDKKYTIYIYYSSTR